MSLFDSMLGISVEHAVSLVIIAYTSLFRSWRFPCAHLSALENVSVIPHIILFQSAKLSTCWTKHRWWFFQQFWTFAIILLKLSFLHMHPLCFVCTTAASFAHLSLLFSSPATPQRFCFSFLCPCTGETWSIVCIWFILLHMVISKFTHFPSNNILLLFFMV